MSKGKWSNYTQLKERLLKEQKVKRMNVKGMHFERMDVKRMVFDVIIGKRKLMSTESNVKRIECRK